MTSLSAHHGSQQDRSLLSRIAVFGLICGASLCASCAVDSEFDREFVASELGARSGSPPAAFAAIGASPGLPPEVTLRDGLSEEEAVGIALWNNADFNADLAAIGMARADLVEAGLLPNPVLSLLFPGTSTVREGTLSIPISLVRRPARIVAAQLDLEEVANNLVQSGLGLVRDVRIAYSGFGLAQTRFQLATESLAVIDEIAAISESQFQAGQISRLESARSQSDRLRAIALQQEAVRDLAVTESRLLGLLGLTEPVTLIPMNQAEQSEATMPMLESLLEIAMASRPDLRAAEIAVESAAESADWERQAIYEFVALLDYGQVRGQSGADTGPGFEFTLPLFDRNQGGRQRAAARIEEAAFRYLAAQQRVTLQVGESYATYLAAIEAASAWRDGVVPELVDTVEQTQQAFDLGSVSQFAVLLARQQLLEARISEAAAVSELGRASATLAYAVGQRIGEGP